MRMRGRMGENKYREIFDVLKADIIAGKYAGMLRLGGNAGILLTAEKRR